jgi:3-deoxy-D-manno-octulosonate 8-phosphate phosphatase KdsC-like HAD superfamily phosphatase
MLLDGRVELLPDFGEIKYFSIYDGIAIPMAQRFDIEVGFMSGLTSG